MTDTFVVDQAGAFVVGKAQTTPHDESEGFMRSAHDALAQWGTDVDSAFPQVASGIFSGTAMLNRLLSRQGLLVGAIVTAGHEDTLRIERAIQTYLGYPYGDRLHVATHHHNPPLVARENVHGVRGRIDLFGEEVLPLREQDVRDAATALLDAGVAGIVVGLLSSYRNGMHEQRVAEILREEIAARGLNGDAPTIFVSSELYPSRRDLPRLNSTVVEAYAAEPSRGTLRAVNAKTHEHGATFELRVMAGHGGTISIEARELARTLVSGPIGGVVGGRTLAQRLSVPNVLCTDIGGTSFELRVMAGHGGTISIEARELARTLVSGPIGGVVGGRTLAQRLSVPNVLCTDIGGTSFDIALITDGDFEVTATPDIARFVLNTPLVKIDSIGAGTGSFVRVNPNSGRPELGPDSAGANVGVCWPEGGLETISVTDLNLVLGRLNPDYFLGGELDLDVERAEHAVARQLAGPLGLSVPDAAAGVIDLFEQTLRHEAVGRILGKGYSPVDYTLLCYGGGGPLHVAGYTEGVPYREVLVPAWAAGFSAYGCACADFEYRFEQTVDMPIPPDAPPEAKAGGGGWLTSVWMGLRERVLSEFAKSGVQPQDVKFTHLVRMQYAGQLNDLEIVSPHDEISSAEQLDDLVAEFERAYAKLYARSARSPELGYVITQAIVLGDTDVEKPALPDIAAAGEAPAASASKGTREVRWSDTVATTEILQLEELVPGNVIAGPAIVEHSATTFAIPPGRAATLDSHLIFHLSAEEA